MKLFFWKNKSLNKINPATDNSLQVVSAKTGLLSFDNGSNPSNLNINISAITTGAAIGVQNKTNTTINPATEETLSGVRSAVVNFNFDTSAGNGLKVSGTSPALVDSPNVKDSTATNINPASDEATILWRRMTKLMEAKMTVDAGRNKRVVVDSFGTDLVTGLGPSTTLGPSGSTVPLTTMSSDSTFTTITISNSLDGWGDQMFQDVARNAYARSIRNNLIFS